MKTKYLFIILIITPIFTFSQNRALAKTYYEKAQTELNAKNYSKTLEYIEKSKEYAGSTNPDIMYVELKARYTTDININKTKELCNAFLKEAFEDDNRVNEVAEIMIKIEENELLRIKAEKKKNLLVQSGYDLSKRNNTEKLKKDLIGKRAGYYGEDSDYWNFEKIQEFLDVKIIKSYYQPEYQIDIIDFDVDFLLEGYYSGKKYFLSAVIRYKYNAEKKLWIVMKDNKEKEFFKVKKRTKKLSDLYN